MKRKKYLVAHIQGGIGNQMFTYAYGYAYASQKGYELILDTDEYIQGYFRPLELKRLAIKYRGEWCNIGNSIVRLLCKRYLIRYRCIREKKEFVYQEAQVDIESNHRYLYLEGYWQSEKYFLKRKNEIKNLFQLTKLKDRQIVEKFERNIRDNISVSVHVRRGDYVGGGRMIGDDYYLRALDRIEKLINKPTYYVFSDDIEYAMTMKCFKDRAVKYIGNNYFNDDLISLYAMSVCKHHVIANSTFSWWAAWLSKNESGIVIAPNLEYLADSDFYPQDWIQLDTTMQ